MRIFIILIVLALVTILTVEKFNYDWTKVAYKGVKYFSCSADFSICSGFNVDTIYLFKNTGKEYQYISKAQPTCFNGRCHFTSNFMS